MSVHFSNGAIFSASLKKVSQYTVKSLIVPRRNEVAEGGYCITLRQSVRPA